MSSRGAWLAVLALGASCSLVDSARDTGGGGSDGGGVGGDDGGDPAADAPTACDPGNPVEGLTVFNASPIDAASACGLDNALVRDDNVAGLDLFDSTEQSCDRMGEEMDVGGCGCVGVDLGVAQELASIIVRAAPIEDACGGACEGGDCGTGHSFTAWYGIELGPYTLASDESLTDDQLADYQIDIGGPARYVVVCRDWWSQTRDDVAVDSIEAICGP